MAITVEELRLAGKEVRSLLALDSSPVAVRFVFEEEQAVEQFMLLTQHRYCQAVMKARHGQHVILDADGIACPAAAAAFGFRELPEGLKNGKGLVGFGIVQDPAVGKTMFENMSYFPEGNLKRIELSPLDRTIITPDIIVIEALVEQLMWVNLAYLNVNSGKRLVGSTAILQATCVDASIIPYLEQRLNFGFGCYGCREATDLSQEESIIGFPTQFLNPIMTYLRYLAQKAIPKSRQKAVYQHLMKNSS